MHLLGYPGHVLADLHSRRRGVDRPEGVRGIVRVPEQKIDQLLPLVGLPGLEKRPGLLDVGNPGQQVKVGSSQVFLVGRRFRRIHTRFPPGTFQQPVDETSAPRALALLGARFWTIRRGQPLTCAHNHEQSNQQDEVLDAPQTWDAGRSYPRYSNSATSSFLSR